MQRTEKSERSRRQVLDAALQLFSRHGYRATVLAYHMAPIRPIATIRELVRGLLFGGVPPRILARQLLRSYLPKSLYRSLVNQFVHRFGQAGK